MPDFTEQLAWIDTQRQRMIDLVTRWSNINSHTRNLVGLARMTDELERAFAPLAGHMQRHTLPPMESIDDRGNVIAAPLGEALSITKRTNYKAAPPGGPRARVLLCIHMDTVYPADAPFQSVRAIDAHTLAGPGVADAKGGLAVMLVALEALERSPAADKVAWEVLINPDEEVGSPGSIGLLRAAAARNDVGLLFEPSLPDGALIARRKGSGNFTVVVRGRSAHAGRDAALGRNAIHLLAELITSLASLNGARPGLTVNAGIVTGGTASNQVPDLAIARLNVRVAELADQAFFTDALDALIAKADAREGYRVTRHGSFYSPPKLVDARTESLFKLIASCAADLNLPLTWRDSGGVCDGNKLAAAGLPNLDTLGPRGGDIHSDREYLIVDSLTERAKLTALTLMRLGIGEMGAEHGRG